MSRIVWSPVDISDAEYVGILDVDDDNFEVVATPTHLVFGGFCNVGMLQSGYIVREEFESLNETLQELNDDLCTFYRDGGEYTNRIVVNERM